MWLTGVRVTLILNLYTRQMREVNFALRPLYSHGMIACSILFFGPCIFNNEEEK